MTPNWRCIWGKITRSTGLRGLSSHDALFYSWGFTQPDAWGLLRRADAKGAIFPYRSTEGQVQKAIDVLIERKKLCEHHHNGHVYVHWCNWDEWQPETVRWRMRSKLEPPFSFVCPNECGLVRTSPLEKKRKETKRNDPRSGEPSGSPLKVHFERFLGAQKMNHQVAALVDASRCLHDRRLDGGRLAAIIKRHGHGQEVINALMQAASYRAVEPCDYMERVLQNAKTQRGSTGRAQPAAARNPDTAGWERYRAEEG